MKLIVPETVTSAIANRAPIAVGVSGGKDSCAVAFAVDEHIGRDYPGPKILIHSDLGVVEWKDSLPTCQRLADRLGWELVVVRRNAGDMMDRWEQRWENNLDRYIDLECVKLIIPWSTPSMRFCTSELKSAVIASELKRRFGGNDRVPILSVTGVRADESASRAKQEPLQRNARLERKSDGTHGYDWLAIHNWSTAYVYHYLAERNFELHEAYRIWKSTRVSCCFCIMSSMGDLNAAVACPDNHGIYLRMVELEIRSTFSFQKKWLGDLAPQLLDADTRSRLEDAKVLAQMREHEEARIPKRLEYEKGWPRFVPSSEECELVADVRRKVSRIVGIEARYLTGSEVRDRYQQLFDEKQAKKVTSNQR